MSEPKTFYRPYAHLLAGGFGGMVGATLTMPLDLVKTRLQSDAYAKMDAKRLGTAHAPGLRSLLYAFVETGHILRATYRSEGFTALFRGLGPTLVGAIPARSINFFTYGNGKIFFSSVLSSDGKETTVVHLLSAATAGIVTSTCTNPIWVIKTRLQLEPSLSATSAIKSSPVTDSFSRSYNPRPAHYIHTSTLPNRGHTTALLGSLRLIRHIWIHEGLRGFYRGLSASYMGVSEGVIQWTCYEQFKKIAARRSQGEETYLGKGVAAGAAKLCGTVVTYPHEVVRTRLRQQPPPGKPLRYTGLVQTFRLVYIEEGIAGLFGGLSPHLLRVLPNAIVMYLVYERSLKFFGVKA